MRNSASARELPPARDRELGAVATCGACGEQVTRCETAPTACQPRTLAYWSDCACRRREVARGESIVAAAMARNVGRDIEKDPAEAYDLEALASAGVYSFDTFRRDWLEVADGAEHPLDRLRRWVAEILEHPTIGRYEAGPVAALWLVGDTGRGKTHAAVGAALEVRTAGRRVALVNERQYLLRRFSRPFAELEALVVVPGAFSFLTIFDDLGKEKPTNAGERQRIQNAWGAVIDARYTARRYTLFTSEHTPEELHDQGVIDLSIYGRIYEMTRGAIVFFDGQDARRRADRYVANN